MEYQEFILPKDIKDYVGVRQAKKNFHMNLRSAQDKRDKLFTIFEQCNWRFVVIVFS